MRRLTIPALAVLVLILDWAAADDITTGQESSLAMEYAALILSVPILVLMAWRSFAGAVATVGPAPRRLPKQNGRSKE